MELIKKKVSELIPYINNSRTHSEEQITQLISSIKEFGFTNPILIDKENSIIAGHGRLLAVKRLGHEEVPCIIISGLTKTQIKALIIADNQLALNAGWDLEKLSVEIEGLEDDKFDIGILGFDDKFLNSLQDEKKGLTEDDAIPETKDNPKSKLGDIWILNNHRLLCGDSTQPESLKVLFKGNKADMVFTDPPYNVDYGKIKGNQKNNFRFKDRTIKNDNMSDEEFFNFLSNFVIESKNYVKLGSPYYICYGERSGIQFLSAFKNAGLKHSCNIIWKKHALVLGRSDYHYIHEPIFYGWFEGATHKYYGDRKQISVWEFDRPTKSILHPTMKPVELICKAIENSSKQEDIIYEPFCGSGSTLIASEKLNRICYGIELDTKFVDVIIQRWQQFTGKEAINEQSGKTYNSI